MNLPPETAIRVPHPAMHEFVSTASQTVGLPPDRAELLARLLTENDLRGIFSHGTRQISRYAIWMRDGKLNNRPNVRVIRETPVSILIDGDNGLGYFPAYEGTLRLIEKAESQGMAALLTRNHGHLGAAGIYARQTLGHDLITFVTSGFKKSISPGEPVYNAVGGSPFSFSAPTDEEDPLILDFGAIHDLTANSPHREEITRLTPGIVHRAIGLSAVCQAWGGLLAEAPLDASQGGNPKSMGAFIFTCQIALFTDPARFKREMDEYVRNVRSMSPLEGFSQAYLPGGPEADREREYRKEGIPVGPEHQDRLEKLAADLGINVPWKS